MTLVPTSLVAMALDVTPEAVRKLRERGLLSRHGTKTRALYDIAEVIAFAVQRDTRRTQTAHAA